MIKCVDYLIDLGLEGGNKGGIFIKVGILEELCKVEELYIGKYLKKVLY